MKILIIDRLSKYFIYEENGNKCLEGDFFWAGFEYNASGAIIYYMIKQLTTDQEHISIIRFPIVDVIIKDKYKSSY